MTLTETGYADEVEVVEHESFNKTTEDYEVMTPETSAGSDDVDNIRKRHDYHQPNIVNEGRRLNLKMFTMSERRKGGRQAQSYQKQCSFCLIKFRQPSEFLKHKENLRKYCLIKDNLKRGASGRYSCKIRGCGKLFAAKSNLKRPLTNLHQP